MEAPRFAFLQFTGRSELYIFVASVIIMFLMVNVKCALEITCLSTNPIHPAKCPLETLQRKEGSLSIKCVNRY